MSYPPFISPTDLEALLGQALANPTALIVAISLDSACESVRTYLGQVVNKITDDVEIHSGSIRKKLRLRQRPVRSVAEVKVDDVVLDATTYKVRGHVITLPDDTWASGNDNVAVKYTHGWDVAEPTSFPVPADIRLVALLIARRVYQAVGYTQTGSAGTIIKESIGEYSYELSDAAGASVSSAAQLAEAETMILDRYRITLVGDTPTQP